MSFPATRQQMIDAGYAFSNAQACRGCGEPIVFWFTPDNKRIPMNPMPEADSPTKSHFVTCPKAEEFRRKKGRGCRQPAKSATTQTSLL